MEIQHKYSISRRVGRPLPPNIICHGPSNKWAEVAQNEGWFRNRGGTHSDLVNNGDCEATLGTCMHFILRRGAGSGTTSVHIALWPWHWRQIWLYTDVADNVNITRMGHRRMLGLRYVIRCHVGRIAPVSGPHSFPWHVICFNPNFRYRSHNQAGPDGICDRQQY